MRDDTYLYPLECGSLLEAEAVIMAYEGVGWKFVRLEPDGPVFPTHIVFEWQKGSPAIYPSVYGWK